MDAGASSPYSGTDTLEVMQEAENYNRFLASLIDRHLRPGATVMDFGAGTGTFALPLLARGVNLICVEPDETLNARLRRSGARVYSSLEEVPDGSVDLIYTFNVLEHIDDDRAAVHGLAAKLKVGGRLLVYVPAFQILYSAFDRKIGHRRRYRRNGLVAILGGCGFQGVSARYADSLGFLAALIYRALGDRNGGINLTMLRAYDRFVFPVSRILDRALGLCFGKNVTATAVKPRPQHKTEAPPYGVPQ